MRKERGTAQEAREKDCCHKDECIWTRSRISGQVNFDSTVCFSPNHASTRSSTAI